METVRRLVEILSLGGQAPGEQDTLIPPLRRLPLRRVDAPQVNKQSLSKGSHDLETTGHRIVVDVDRIQAPRVSKVGHSSHVDWLPI